MPRYETYQYCEQCPWQPDPARRMSADTQAEEHTKTEGHATHSGLRPEVRRG